MRQMLTTRSIGIYILSMQDYEMLYASILKQYLQKHKYKYSIHIDALILLNIYVA